MAESLPASVWAYRGLYAALAFALLFLRMLPLGSVAGAWPGPDLLVCLTFAWVLRRPDYAPVLLVAAVMRRNSCASAGPLRAESVLRLNG
jgi:rod shape-determining protein MreD